MNLKIKNIDLKAFIFNRLIEIFAIVLFLLAILLFLAMISYTPDDPNFIFSEGQKVKNFPDRGTPQRSRVGPRAFERCGKTPWNPFSVPFS